MEVSDPHKSGLSLSVIQPDTFNLLSSGMYGPDQGSPTSFELRAASWVQMNVKGHRFNDVIISNERYVEIMFLRVINQ